MNRSKLLLHQTFLWPLIFYHFSIKHALSIISMLVLTESCPRSSSLSRDVRCTPFFKMTKPLKNVSTAHGILYVSHDGT
jgi:hypothetical protein